MKPQRKRMTALIQASLVVFLLLFHLHVKEEPKIRDAQVHNAISLMFPEILTSRSPRSFVGVDIPSVS